MDTRVKNFIETVARNVVGLDVALFFQANPTMFDTAAGLALRLHYGAAELEPCLQRLAEHQILAGIAHIEGVSFLHGLNNHPSDVQVRRWNHRHLLFRSRDSHEAGLAALRMLRRA